MGPPDTRRSGRNVAMVSDPEGLTPCRLPGCRASLHVLDALDKRRMLARVLVPDGLDRGLERLAVGHLVDDTAALLDLRQRLLLHLVPEAALLLLCFLREL